MKNIVVAINFDTNDQKVLDMALALGKAFNAKLWVLHIAAPDPDFVGYEAGPQSVRDARAVELRTEHKRIQELAATLEKKGVPSEGLLIQGATVDTLIEEAKELRADLLIVGRRKHDFLHKTFRGSISKGVLKKSKIPVLVVPEDP